MVQQTIGHASDDSGSYALAHICYLPRSIINESTSTHCTTCESRLLEAKQTRPWRLGNRTQEHTAGRSHLGHMCCNAGAAPRRRRWVENVLKHLGGEWEQQQRPGATHVPVYPPFRLAAALCVLASTCHSHGAAASVKGRYRCSGSMSAVRRHRPRVWVSALVCERKRTEGVTAIEDSLPCIHWRTAATAEGTPRTRAWLHGEMHARRCGP
mmetsp:Transcript_2911/g.5154  ORF Transcript_2911/g.5154 Transcript_2911/m.5154 type:complete len:211 (+) Transcript_2911:34-666(+)